MRIQRLPDEVMETISFFVPCHVGVKGNSKEIVWFGNRPALKGRDRDRADERTLAYLVMEHRPREPWTGPVLFEVTFVLPIPASWPIWKREAALAGDVRPITGKDRGNMLKLAEDAFAGSFYLNDSQVVTGNVSKDYGPVEGYDVTIQRLREPHLVRGRKARAK